MAKGKTKPAPAVTPKEYTPQEFAKAYAELCARMGYEHGAAPVWQLRDDGTYSLIIQFSIKRKEANA